MNGDITTAEASLVLGPHFQHIEEDILLSQLPCEGASNRAFIFNELNHKFCKVGYLVDVPTKIHVTRMTTFVYHSFS